MVRAGACLHQHPTGEVDADNTIYGRRVEGKIEPAADGNLQDVAPQFRAKGAPERTKQ